MKSPWNVPKATPLFLLLLSHSLASVPYEDPPGASYSNGHNCAGCVVVVSVIEQLAQVHNSSVQVAMERLCTYLPVTYSPTNTDVRLGEFLNSKSQIERMAMFSSIDGPFQSSLPRSIEMFLHLLDVK
ncbi:hypothetical protein STEG23_026743, partial [Scotinomys teguina]